MIKIKQNHLLPFIVRLACIVVFVAVMLNMFRSDLSLQTLGLYACTMLFCAMVFSARHMLEIDGREKICRQYVWVMGMKLGGSRSYDSIEKLFINKVKYVRPGSVLNYHAQTQSFLYKCFLKFDDGEKIQIDQDVDLDRLSHRLLRYNESLCTTIFDTTGHEVVILAEPAQG